MPPLQPTDIQRMFEDLQLGTEEARARFLCFTSPSAATPNVQVFTQLASFTEQPAQEPETYDAKLA